MNDARQIISNLKKRGVTVVLRPNSVEIHPEAAELTDEEKDQISRNHDEIVGYLRALRCPQRPNTFKNAASAPKPTYSQLSWWNWAQGKDDLEPRIFFARRYRGVDVQTVTSAVHTIVNRHDCLRSSFKYQDGQLNVSLNEAGTLAIELLDLRKLDVAYVNSTLSKVAQEFCRQPLPMAGRWLTSVRLVQLPVDDILVLVGLNHIIADGASNALIIAEMDELVSLEGSERDRVEQLKYYDFAATEREWLDRREMAELIEYWKAWYTEKPPLRGPSGIHLHWCGGARVPFNFSFRGDVSKTIEDFAKRNATSAPLVYVTALLMAVAQWAGQGFFVSRLIGDKRTSRELRNVVGLMVTADPIAVQASADREFSSILEDVHRQYYGALRLRLPSLHVQPPYCARPADIGAEHHNLIPVTVNFHSTNIPLTHVDGIEESNSRWPPLATQTDPEILSRTIAPIELQMRAADPGLSGTFLFNASMLSSIDQKKIISDFFRVMGGVLS
jgi:hypothetical protein